MDYFIVLTIGYIVGSINSSIIITKLLKGIDIRDVNSHNPGASNTTLTLGLKWGVVVFCLDVFKGFLPVFIVKFLFPDTDLLWILAGFGALIGHVYPLFFKFKGGKGTSTYLGVAFGINPLLGFILLITLIVTTLISDYIVVGTVFLMVPLPIYMFITGDFHFLSITLITVFMILNLARHSNNFIALFKGEEKGVKDALKGKNQ